MPRAARCGKFPPAGSSRARLPKRARGGSCVRRPGRSGTTRTPHHHLDHTRIHRRGDPLVLGDGSQSRCLRPTSPTSSSRWSRGRCRKCWSGFESGEIRDAKTIVGHPLYGGIRARVGMTHCPRSEDDALCRTGLPNAFLNGMLRNAARGMVRAYGAEAGRHFLRGSHMTMTAIKPDPRLGRRSARRCTSWTMPRSCNGTWRRSAGLRHPGGPLPGPAAELRQPHDRRP